MNAKEQLESLKNQKEYCKQQLKTVLTKCERSEYMQLITDYDDEIIRLNKHIQENSEIFNSL